MTDTARHVLLIGASRGLGLALTRKWLSDGRHVTATVRNTGGPAIRELAAEYPDTLTVETLDVTDPDGITVLHERLAGLRFGLLFHCAGTTNQPEGTVAETSTEEFVRVMVTNALSPMRVVETFQDLVEPTGTIGVMTSGQGSVANNASGGHEVYRGSKAALNTSMRSYDARHRGEGRTLILMAPSWVRTELGGPDAPISVEDSVSGMVGVLDGLAGRTGLHYVDYQGRTVAW